MHHPTTTHFETAKRVLRYVKGTLNHGIHFSPGPLTLSAFANADWASDPTDRCSTIGFIVFLGSNPVSWSSKKQSTISRSSIEAEYITLATTTTELACFVFFLKNFDYSFIMFLCYGVITCLLLHSLQIQFFICTPNVLKWTITMSVKSFFERICVFVLSLARITWLMSSSSP